MNAWYSLSLGDGMMAGSPSAEIEELFVKRFREAGKPPAMAVFTRPESEGRLYCEVIAYFSPGAADVARAFDAEPVTLPALPGRVTMAAGLDSKPPVDTMANVAASAVANATKPASESTLKRKASTNSPKVSTVTRLTTSL